jgi:thymidylate synthase (FAD)
MKIIKQSATLEFITPNALQVIEKAGRTCYKSEDLITKESAEEFVKKILESGHESVLEHAYASFRFITDRGVTHEMVRHRLVSYSQESTRYCNYSKDKFGNEITIILPVRFNQVKIISSDERWIDDLPEDKFSKFQNWFKGCYNAQVAYLQALQLGDTPQEARDLLPNSLKTEIVMTTNFREWRHFFKLRTSPKAHPQMRGLAAQALDIIRKEVEVVFDNL